MEKKNYFDLIWPPFSFTYCDLVPDLGAADRRAERDVLVVHHDFA